MFIFQITKTTKTITESTETSAALNVAQVKTQLEKAGITYENLKGKSKGEIGDILRDVKTLIIPKTTIEEYTGKIYNALQQKAGFKSDDFSLVLGELAKSYNVENAKLAEAKITERQEKISTEYKLSEKTAQQIHSLVKTGDHKQAAELLQQYMPNATKERIDAALLDITTLAWMQNERDKGNFNAVITLSKVKTWDDLKVFASSHGYEKEFNSIMNETSKFMQDIMRDVALNIVQDIMQRLRQITQSDKELFEKAAGEKGAKEIEQTIEENMNKIKEVKESGEEKDKNEKIKKIIEELKEKNEKGEMDARKRELIKRINSPGFEFYFEPAEQKQVNVCSC